MISTFVDIHIHTSDNPDNLNQNYDVESLYKNVSNIAKGAETRPTTSGLPGDVGSPLVVSDVSP